MFELKSWQQNMLDQINTGFKPGELVSYVSGRRSGKSYYLDQWMQEWAMPGKYTIESQALVDGEPWYTVRIYEPHVIRWLRSQDSSQYDHLKSDHPMITLVDMHEQLYMMMVLKFS